MPKRETIKNDEYSSHMSRGSLTKTDYVKQKEKIALFH